jgi:hypothetical protein
MGVDSRVHKYQTHTVIIDQRFEAQPTERIVGTVDALRTRIY